MNRLTVATWNAEGMFVEGTKTRRATPHGALDVLRTLDADIVVIPEFGRLTQLKSEVAVTIRSLGYQVTTLAYDEPRSPGLGFAILSRFEVERTSVHTLGTSKRQLLMVQCHDERGTKFVVMGVHLDDRSERGRLEEIAAISDIVGQYASVPVLLAGDFNAMHKDAWFARIARSQAIRVLSRRVRHALLRSMSERVQEMALGTTIAYLSKHTTLRDLDIHRKRTISAKQAGLEWIPAWRLAKIDWIFGSHHFKVHAYRVLPDVGSDHRPVVATLTY
jgi:endonuclease/exonuclease/phosphatase family metal-dependent hydrolase